MANRLFYLLLPLSLLALALSVACGGGGDPIVLETTEVREYQGEKLSSVNDFRENSIRGPQQVSREDYLLEVMGLVEKPLSLP